MRHGRWLLVCVALAGCQPYRAGSFQSPLQAAPWPGAQATVGCIEVALAPFPDEKAQGYPVVVSFGNRCDEAVEVDVAAIVVTAELDGRRVYLVPFGTERDRLHAGLLDAASVGTEHLDYVAEGDVSGASRLCADVNGLAPHDDLVAPVCWTTAPDDATLVGSR